MSGLFRALHRTKVFRNLTEQEFAWVLYDVGNSAFIMLACSLIPIWFKSLAIGTGPGKISSDQATAYYSIAISIVTVVVAQIGGWKEWHTMTMRAIIYPKKIQIIAN